MSYHRIYYYGKQHWQVIAVCLVAVGFFLFASVLNFKSQDKTFVKWLSPDETANYAIAKHYAQTGSLMFFEKDNLLAHELIHPRSFRSDYGWVKPVSFIGLPLFYGALARVFGIGILPYLTPLIGALGLVVVYLLVKELFGKSAGLIAAALLAVFPVYIYFSSRSFFHNILFTVAALTGLYFAVKAGKTKRPAEGTVSARFWKESLLSLLAGVAIGIAVAARTSELLWLGPLLVGLYIFNVRRFGPLKLFFFAYGALLALAPVMYWNEVLYGSWRAMGYPELNSSLSTLGENSSTLFQTAAAGKWYDLRPLAAKVKMTIFHFGYKPEQSLKMWQAYVVTMFPWLVWLGGVGIALYVVRFRHYAKERWLFLFGWIALSLVLVLYYGSWVFYDNPDPNSFTIGNSYTRYWLPVYIGGLVFASVAITTVSGWLRQRFVIGFVRLAAVVVIAVFSIGYVWYEPSEGLAVSIDKQVQARGEWQVLLGLTEPNAVIITRYHDKLLFPERRVIVGLFNDKNMIAEYAKLAKRVPLYYYNFTFPEKDMVHLNTGMLREAGISLEVVKQVTEKFTLYRIMPLHK